MQHNITMIAIWGYKCLIYIMATFIWDTFLQSCATHSSTMRPSHMKEEVVLFFNTCSLFSLAPVTSGCYLNSEVQRLLQEAPGQPFQRDSHKQSSYKFRQSSFSKGQFSTKDEEPSQSKFRSGGREQGPVRKEKDNKGSQQYRSFNKRGRGGGGNQRI